MATPENININGTVNVGEIEQFASDTSSSNSVSTDALLQIFTQSNIVIILWFLAVYFVVYILLSIFRGSDNVKPSISKWIDIVALLAAMAYLMTTFFAKTEEEKSKMVGDLYDQFKTYLDSPLSLISVGFFILTLYIVIYILEIPMNSVGKPITISLIENGAWGFFVIIMIASFLKYVANISIYDIMDKADDYKIPGNVSAKSGNTSAKGNTISSAAIIMDEVFNIGNNMYTYDDAQSVCASMGSRLATYDEVEDAYEKGAEWCNYGWSEGQAAYFPTQKETWKKLQKSESTKHACGRPGINGGFINNPDVRLGVNCYGKKPRPKPGDLAKLGNNVLPKSPEDLILDKKIQFWKDNGDKLFTINGYNNTKWSAY